MKHLIYVIVFSMSQLLGITSKAGVYFEHKFIGDSSFRRFIRELRLELFFRNEIGMRQFEKDACIPYNSNPTIIEYYPGLFYFGNGTQHYSYGDLTALSGDHSVSVMQIMEGLFRDTIILRLPHGEVYRKLTNELTIVWTRQRNALDDRKKEANYFFLAYVLLANGDKSHFQHPPWNLEKMLSQLPVDFIDLYNSLMNHPVSENNEKELSRLRSKVERTFLRFNNSLKYSFLHLIALDYMQNAAVAYYNKDTANFQISFQLSLISNAFADHFLQDAFAAGHIPVHRTIFGLDNKGVHDYYCRNGLYVSNQLGDSWRTYGDKFYDSVTFAHAIDANTTSLKELWNYFKMVLELKKSHADFNKSLYEQFSQKEIMLKEYAITIVNFMPVFKNMPIPLNETGYREINLKRGSKIGGYLDLMSFYYGNGSYPGLLIGLAPVGLDLTKYEGKKNEEKRRKLFDSKKETIWWVGFAGNYSRWKREKSIVHTITGGINLTYIDCLVLESSWGSIHEDKSYFLWRPMLGYEIKSLRFALATSFKLFYDFTCYKYKQLGIGLNLRLY